MAKNITLPFPTCLAMIFVISRLISTLEDQARPFTHLLSLHTLLSSKLRLDPAAIATAATDFGGMVRTTPAAVYDPTSIDDIVSLLRVSYNLSVPFKVTARGRGHSIRGQAMAAEGVVVNMLSLNGSGSSAGAGAGRIRVLESEKVVDVGGEQLWIDVLRETLKYEMTPEAWTDYLYLSVGGTLSNAGISGQAFRYGPQISNVLELDVITGKGEMVKCTREENSELFNGVLGGLGQFGIITRARVALGPAPHRVKWVRMIYKEFEELTRDQEYLITKYNDKGVKGIDYVEGSLIINKISPPNNWRSSFFSSSAQSKISSLSSPSGILYCLEVVKYYRLSDIDTVDQELEEQLKGLRYIEGYKFTKDVSYVEFLNRVRRGELELQAKGLWDVPHPWLNLFVPKSHILDFNAAVFVNIISKHINASGPILVYPLNRNKWDDRMSAVIPEGDVFYTVGFLHSSGHDDWQLLEDRNKEIIRSCEENGIEIKQYLPHYDTTDDWQNHFGSKWQTFKERKAMFDPKMILSPGQRIFT